MQYSPFYENNLVVCCYLLQLGENFSSCDGAKWCVGDREQIILENGAQRSIAEVRVHILPPEMRRYFSALYHFRVDTPDHSPLIDCHYPDWAGIHFVASGHQHRTSINGEPAVEYDDCIANGPTTRALGLELRTSLSWSIGLTPVGWARYANGAAADLANKVVDANEHPAFAKLAPICEIVQEKPGEFEHTARRIEKFLSAIRPACSPHEGKVEAIHNALREPAIGDVESLAETLGFSRRTLERLTSRFFGFPPKTLLRRQRFLRSLSRFTVEPGRSWSMSVDDQYVDQAHFVREFRTFMGMTPSEYAQMPHPLLDSIFVQRLAEHGPN